MINDKRGDKSKPWGYVVFKDTFLSGWGHAQGRRSLYALAVSSMKEADIVIDNGSHRTDMRDPVLVLSCNFDGTPQMNLSKSDHISVVDREDAERWYEPEGFAK